MTIVLAELVKALSNRKSNPKLTIGLAAILVVLALAQKMKYLIGAPVVSIALLVLLSLFLLLFTAWIVKKVIHSDID